MRKRGNCGLGMCRRQGNTCEKRKKMKKVCARGRGIHAREVEIMDWVCARGKGTHAKKEKR